jgi:hypothetical protein
MSNNGNRYAVASSELFQARENMLSRMNNMPGSLSRVLEHKQAKRVNVHLTISDDIDSHCISPNHYVSVLN